MEENNMKHDETGNGMSAGELSQALEAAIRSDDAVGLATLVAQEGALGQTFRRRSFAPVRSDDMRVTPLALAAWLGHPRCVEALLAAGVDVDENSPGFGDAHGWGTALWHAASGNSEREAQGNEDASVYAHAAAKMLLGKLACVDLLVEAGADVEGGVFGELISTPLMSAVGWSCEMMDLLVRHGARVEAVPACGRTVLIQGVFVQNEKLSYADNLSWIMERGARALIDCQDNEGNTALSWAANFSSAHVLSTLISAGAGLDIANAKGQSPLFRACSMNKLLHVQLLVEAGADIDSPDNEGRRPLFLAAETKSSLLSALLEKGADVSARSLDGRTSLHQACQAGIVENVEALLRAGAEVDARDGKGVTPLMVAAKHGRYEMIRLLVEKGADVIAVDAAGMSVWGHADSKDIVAMGYLCAMVDDCELRQMQAEAPLPTVAKRKTRL